MRPLRMPPPELQDPDCFGDQRRGFPLIGIALGALAACAALSLWWCQ